MWCGGKFYCSVKDGIHAYLKNTEIRVSQNLYKTLEMKGLRSTRVFHSNSLEWQSSYKCRGENFINIGKNKNWNRSSFALCTFGAMLGTRFLWMGNSARDFMGLHVVSLLNWNPILEWCMQVCSKEHTLKKNQKSHVKVRQEGVWKGILPILGWMVNTQSGGPLWLLKSKKWIFTLTYLNSDSGTYADILPHLRLLTEWGNSQADPMIRCVSGVDSAHSRATYLTCFRENVRRAFYHNGWWICASLNRFPKTRWSIGWSRIAVDDIFVA